MQGEFLGVMFLLGSVWVAVTFIAAIIVAVDAIQVAHYSKITADEAVKQTELLRYQVALMQTADEEDPPPEQAGVYARPVQHIQRMPAVRG